MNLKFYTIVLLLIAWAGITHAQNFTDLPAFKKANSWRMFKSVDYDTATWTIPTYIADFNVSPPAFQSLSYLEVGNYGNATAADTGTGALLFYTDSKTIWNRDFEAMLNGNDLSGDAFADQGSCIVAKINDPGKYYVFTIAAYEEPPRLRYSVVDMSLDGGKGDVIPGEKNILLDEGPLGDMMIAIPGKQCDVWLLVHPFFDPVFKAYHITEDGIDPDPVLSYTDSTLYGLGAYVRGHLAVSPDRSKIALASSGLWYCFFLGYYSNKAGGTLLAEFDPATGTVFNDTKLNDSVAYGVAFSPDGNLLYTCDVSAYEVEYGAASDTGRTYQYDVSDYPASLTLTNIDVLTKPYYGCITQLRMLPNGHLLGNTLAYYTAPNEIGSAAGLDTSRYDWWPTDLYTSTAFFYDVPGGAITLGNDMVFALGPDTTSITTDTFFCKGGSLSIDLGTAGTAYTWNDGSSDSARAITLSGKYWVSYLADRCNVRVDTFNIAEYDPGPDLGADTVLCGDPYTLIPSVKQEGMSFRWSDGSSNNSLALSQSGTYWVATNIKGCTGSDTIHVKAFPNVNAVLGDDIAICKGEAISLTLSVPAYEGASYSWNTGDVANTIAVSDTGTYTVLISMPPCNGEDEIRIYREVCDCYFDVSSAFSPNGDGLNDQFTIALEPGCPVYGYMLSVYNRYGQQIYEGSKPGDGWDGRYKGTPVDAGVYMYEVRFFGGTKQELYTRKGDITLIR